MRTLFQPSSPTVCALFLLSVNAGCHAPAVDKIEQLEAPRTLGLIELLQFVDAKSDAVANSKLVFPPRRDVAMPNTLRELLRRDDATRINLCYGFECRNGKPGWFWRSSPNNLRIVGKHVEIETSILAHMAEHGFEPFDSPRKSFSLAFRKQHKGALETAMLNCCHPVTGGYEEAVESALSWRIEANEPAALPTFAEVRRIMPSVNPLMQNSEPPMMVIEQLPEFPMDLVEVNTHGQVLYSLTVRVPDSAKNAAQRDALADQVIEILMQNGYKQFEPTPLARPGRSSFNRLNTKGTFNIWREPSHLEIRFVIRER